MGKGKDKTTDAVSSEAVDLAHNIGAKFIAALTLSGFTARVISRFRPTQEILAFTPDEYAFNQLNLSFGVRPALLKNKFERLSQVSVAARKYCLENKIAQKRRQHRHSGRHSFRQKRLHQHHFGGENIKNKRF